LSGARELLAEVREELAPLEDAIRNHRYLDALERAHVSDNDLRAFADEQRLIIASDRRSFEHLAARFLEPPAGEFFAWMAQGEREALGRLGLFAADVGGHDYAHSPRAGCHAYPAYVAWLAVHGTRADIALAFLANLSTWGANCARIARALRGRYDVSFFDFFAPSPPSASKFEEQALAVLEQGLAAGECVDEARRAARLLQAYELMFWDTLHDAL
jgi:hypothetical protein